MLDLMLSWNACVSILSFILRRCTSTSSSSLPVNSGMKCDQFNCGTWAGLIGCVGIGCAGGTISCIGCMGSCTGGMTGGGAGGAPSATFTYIMGS